MRKVYAPSDDAVPGPWRGRLSPRAARRVAWWLAGLLALLALAGIATGGVTPSEALWMGAALAAMAAGIAGGLFDRVERRRAQEALRRREEQFRRAIVDAPIPIMMHAEDGEILELGREWSRLTGYTREDIPTFQDWLALACGGAAEQMAADVRRRFEGIPAADAEFVIRTRTGEQKVWSFAASAPGRLPDGRRFLVGMAADVTERRLAEEALRDSQERLRLAVEATELGTWDFNPVTGRLTWSERCKAIHGLTLDDEDAEMEYGTFLACLHPDDFNRAAGAVQHALDPEGGGEYDDEYRAVGGDGVVRWITAKGRAFFEGAGEDRRAVRFIGTVRDITEAKRVEAELLQAKEAAEAANQAKDRFLAALSHELRTPLTPVLARVSNLEAEAALDGKLRRELAVIRRNVELEARLIDDLLDLTRITRGKLELRCGPGDLRAYLEHALETCRSHNLEAKGVRLSVEMAAVEHRVNADGPRVTQVFWNLLENAIKFTPRGGEIRIRSGHEEGGLLAVEVSDTGLGIEPELLPRIFDAFEQGQRSQGYGGLGLGLAISKSIVEMHGGTLTAESAGTGRGCTFTVRLPRAPADAQAPAPAPPPTAAVARHPLRLLLVEDHVDTAEAMADLLRDRGHEVTVAGCVAEALACVDASGCGGFDLVVSDLGLPDGSGLDLMRELVGRYRLPGIALSGYGTDEDIRRSREAGFARHLTKPVNIQTLEAAILAAALPSGGG
jgi:two-component system CheB/CheR fusion protein